MTKKEAQELKTFENQCDCGGFAWHMNGRPQEQPHMAWCPQYDEYDDWYQALHAPVPNAELTGRVTGPND